MSALDECSHRDGQACTCGDLLTCTCRDCCAQRWPTEYEGETD